MTPAAVNQSPCPFSSFVELLSWGIQGLNFLTSEEARAEVEWILEEIFEIKRHELYLTGTCHSESFACHSEQSSAQDKLRSASRQRSWRASPRFLAGGRIRPVSGGEESTRLILLRQVATDPPATQWRESWRIRMTQEFSQIIRARKKRIPLAYLLGKAHFYREVLEVGPGCLIPRPETEILIDCFIKHAGFAKQDSFSFLDLGSGSGAIGIAILREFPNARATFSDVSPTALEYTRKNIERYGLLDRSELVLSDLFSAPTFLLTRSAGEETGGRRKWDAIVSNPPYLSHADFESLQSEVLAEPREALDGGKDGLEFYRRILQEAHLYLKREGWLVMEIGILQAETIAGWMTRANSVIADRIFKDHSGIDRVVMMRI